MREVVIFAVVCAVCILVIAGVYIYIIQEDEASGDN